MTAARMDTEVHYYEHCATLLRGFFGDRWSLLARAEMSLEYQTVSPLQMVLWSDVEMVVPKTMNVMSALAGSGKGEVIQVGRYYRHCSPAFSKG